LKILLVDNYDSFTYNIVELLRNLSCADITIVKNDTFTIAEALQFTKIIISPGPKIPAESGLLLPLLQAITTQSVLGICLGHQAIAQAFGGSIYNLAKPYHGVQTVLQMQAEHGIFKNMVAPIQVGLYHSWAVSVLPADSDLQVTSTSTEQIIMSIKHKYLNIHGIQFHPESYMSKLGQKIVENWLQL
jgi:anthranilate synthase component II